MRATIFRGLPVDPDRVITIGEALLGREVDVKRERTCWRGRVVALVEHPAVLVEEANGNRVALPIEGSEIDLRVERHGA